MPIHTCHDDANDTNDAMASTTASRPQHAPIRMIEFFSGIGGMRFAVESNVAIAECRAFEINNHANSVYQHNEHCGCSATQTTTFTKLVEQLQPEQHLMFREAHTPNGEHRPADLWTMSPPCQPFTKTRMAKQLDGEDKRTAGFRAIMHFLRQSCSDAAPASVCENEAQQQKAQEEQQQRRGRRKKKKRSKDSLPRGTIDVRPKWLLLENVQGFASSQMIQEWYDCLEACGYAWKEFLWTPMHFGIPNHRMRYYMIAELHSQRFGTRRGDYQVRPAMDVVRPISEYLQPHAIDDVQCFVTETALQQPWAKDLPVVSAFDRVTRCFTAAYGRILHASSGSLLLADYPHAVADVPLEDPTDMIQYHGRLRRFSPSELLRLFGFPAEFAMPSSLKLETQYKLIGNSINVTVVSHVVRELVQGESSSVGSGC